MATFFFCGIGGIGMSAIALYLKNVGHTVWGSDRSFDLGNPNAVHTNLLNAGIRLIPQDGRAITKEIDTFVVSTAVEETIPDIKRARELGLTIKKRAEILADILHSYKGIAIAGTSGKTTTTAMLSHILYENALDPTMINGGISLNTYNDSPQSNMIFGNGEYCVIEADEHDGTIELYCPYISVVSNVSLDHKPLEILRPLFENFIRRTKHGVVINADCPEMQKLKIDHPNILSFSLHNDKADLYASNITPLAKGTAFDLNGEHFELPVYGDYNIQNVLAATAAALHAGVPFQHSMRALQTFKGTKRRLQKLGTEHGITVIDDYAHNPDKIRATLETLKKYPGHTWAVFQPHGFAPTRLIKDELIHVLNTIIDDNLTFIATDIYYVGGTVAKDISAVDIINPVKDASKDAVYIPHRADIIDFLLPKLKDGDKIIVMGARDDSLSDFAWEILKRIKDGNH